MNRYRRKEDYLNNKGEIIYTYDFKYDYFLLTQSVVIILMILSIIFSLGLFLNESFFLSLIFLLIVLFFAYLFYSGSISSKWNEYIILDNGLWISYPFPSFLPEEPERYFRPFDKIISIEGIPSDGITDNMVEIITEDEEISVPIVEDKEWKEFIKIANKAMEKYEKKDY